MLSRDVLDAVPTARTIQGLGQLVVGVKLSSPDVGGSRAMQQTYFAVRGVGGAQSMVTVDGLMTNGTMGDGAVQAYHNEAMISGNGLPDRRRLGGDDDRRHQHEPRAERRRQPVPRRRQVGEVAEAVAGRQPHRRLTAIGVTGVDKIDHFWEFNIEQGGPIMKDKLWFFGAFRHACYDKPIANTFQPDGSLPYPQAYAAVRHRRHRCEQGISDEKMDNPIVRLTWQVSERTSSRCSTTARCGCAATRWPR